MSSGILPVPYFPTQGFPERHTSYSPVRRWRTFRCLTFEVRGAERLAGGSIPLDREVKHYSYYLFPSSFCVAIDEWTSPEGVGRCSSLRASSDHRFIVGALRARRTVCLLLRILPRPRVARAQKIISPRPPLFQHPVRSNTERSASPRSLELELPGV